MPACRMCRERDKTWSGDDPRCAFSDGVFSPDNWNCATANAIRDIVYEGQPPPMPDGVDYRYCDDQKYATVCTHALFDENEDGDWFGSALWVSWYKNHGRTEAMWLLSQRGEPRRPSEHECVQIIEHYRKQAVASGRARRQRATPDAAPRAGTQKKRSSAASAEERE